MRRLRDDEPIPKVTPRRYTHSNGYVLLRWKVGVRSYVEAYEHRIVAGRIAPHVHHVNGVKDDNNLANLAPLSPLEHAAVHSRVDMAEAATLYGQGWTLTRLAVKYGVGAVSVMRSLKRRGVHIRSAAEAWQIRRNATFPVVFKECV